MNKKILKGFGSLLSFIMIFTVVYTVMSNLRKDVHVTAGLENKKFSTPTSATEYYEYYDSSHPDRVYENINTTEDNYEIPNLTADDIIAEACKYQHVTVWDQGGLSYNDGWNPNTPISEKTNESSWIGYENTDHLDCSGFVYAVLRHLGVRLTGYYDGSNDKNNDGTQDCWGRWSPVPLATYSWMYFGTANSDHLPYHIKWINGEEIPRITTYTQREHYDEDSHSYVEDCYYDEWIEKEEIQPGTIVLSPPVNEHGHMWFYIGKFANQSELEEYLTEIGVSTSGLRIVNKGDSKNWSIECSGDDGVIVSNGDPAVSSSRKKGSGYMGFVLIQEEQKEGSYNFGVVKKSSSEFENKSEAEAKTALNNNSTAVGGASFKLTQQVMTDDGRSSAVEKNITTSAGNVTQSGYGDVTIYQNGIGSDKQDIYTIQETSVPSGYQSIDLRGITLNVFKKETDNGYQIDYVSFVKNNQEIGRVTSSQNTNDSKIMDIDGNGTWDLGIVLNKEGTTFTITVVNEEDEDDDTSIDIKKGVKSVENQDSGYYSLADGISVIHDEEEDESADEDESSEKKYTEIELEELQHEWVVETTIPENVADYTRYMITDPIDVSKLDFSGLDRVKVELINAQGKVTKTLVKDTDYKTKYENGVLTVTYIDLKDDDEFYGEFLSSATETDKIRLTFNTTFKVNYETGKLAVLDGVVTNAENQATLTFDNGNGEDQSKKSDKPEVHTGAVSLFKFEDKNGNKVHDEGEKALVGAEFKIALSEEDAKEGKFIKIGGNELIATSNEHGIATFAGLSFGGDAKDDEKNLVNGLYKYDWEKASRKYYIVETKTPAGYEKLDDVIEVTVSKDSSEIIDLTDKINEMESVGNRPLTFDLSLRKWVTQAIVIQDGKTVVTETGHKAEDQPEDVVKVDLKKSKINDVVVKFRYSIRVTNDGEVAGEAQEITDYIPEGLKFVKEDNPDWETTDNERIVKTSKLKGITLETEESAEVEIVLTWVNSAKSMGTMYNTAEISKDYNEFGYNDMDSVPNNKVPDEDDIDNAPVMLMVKTGSEMISYIALGVAFIGIIGFGVIRIRKIMDPFNF